MFSLRSLVLCVFLPWISVLNFSYLQISTKFEKIVKVWSFGCIQSLGITFSFCLLTNAIQPKKHPMSQWKWRISCFCKKLVGAQPPPHCSFAGHLVRKIVIHFSFAHHFSPFWVLENPLFFFVKNTAAKLLGRVSDPKAMAYGFVIHVRVGPDEIFPIFLVRFLYTPVELT